MAMFHEFTMNSVSTQHNSTNGFTGYQIDLDHSTIWPQKNKYFSWKLYISKNQVLFIIIIYYHLFFITASWATLSNNDKENQ